MGLSNLAPRFSLLSLRRDGRSVLHLHNSMVRRQPWERGWGLSSSRYYSLRGGNDSKHIGWSLGYGGKGFSSSLDEPVPGSFEKLSSKLSRQRKIKCLKERRTNIVKKTVRSIYRFIPFSLFYELSTFTILAKNPFHSSTFRLNFTVGNKYFLSNVAIFLSRDSRKTSIKGRDTTIPVIFGKYFK